MTTPTILKDNIEQFRYNPSSIQTSILRVFRDINENKYDFVDPNNPFIFLMEASATVGSSCMVESSNNNRKQYAEVAQTFDDLYRHMPYNSFNDIFTLPTQASFVMGFNKEELLSRMVPDGNKDIRKLIIPRNTTISAGDLVFSLQYPIELRQLSHGELQITYDVEKTTPLRTISTNLIEWKSIRDSNGAEMVMFPLTLDQFNIISLIEVVNAAQKFSASKTITDKFYYCRVWREVGTAWEEIRTTYSQDIYDNTVVTAVVRVIGNQVVVEIPIIYTKTGQISGRVRVDIYETKGPLTADLRSFDPNQFVVNWLAIDGRESTSFVAPLSSMSTTTVYGGSQLTGGREAMAFSALKQRVTTNGFSADNKPITPAQVKSKLERDGYNIVTNMDYITSRTFAATRAMPAPTDSELITPANAGIHTLSETLDNLAVLSTSYRNATSLTLTPKSLYKVERGILSICNDAEIALLNALPGDKKAQAITAGEYFYTPFHYVLDTLNNTFTSRAYYLETPVINSRSFIAENETTLLQVSTSGASFVRTVYGWDIIVTTKSSQEWKDLEDDEVGVTIGFQPDTSGDYAYIVGSLLGRLEDGERVYKFEIKTNYDIDRNNALQLTNAMMYEVSQQFLRTQLEQKFDIFYSTSYITPPNWEPGSFDTVIGNFLLPDGSVGISRERIELEFGVALTNLWSGGRSVVGNRDYAIWEVDVPATYETDVYKVDPVTGASFTIVNGQLVYNKLHSAGDLKYDAEGNVVYKYKAGTVKRDNYGNPIIIGERNIIRQIDLFLVEAHYYFATNKVATDYRNQFVETIVQWISEDLRNISKKLLDKTSIYYYPVQSVGTVEIVYGAGLKSSISAGQFFNLKTYVTDAVYKNIKLREAINRTIIVTINTCLNSKTVSLSQINDALKLALGDDVIAFEIEGLGGDAKLSVCTLVEDSARLTIRKRLEYRPDQTFALIEDINNEFVPYERAGVSIV